ncbi:aquaporin-like protein [Halteromyces radiatus]|uniref:aquaporin-like protein n=1 Tax=Halteromyces radiatus TaxID=101107 RepID=UPI00221F4E18|nr:aquaporin-like protein [Halteromyces radiatus]KAI8092708.1 aquaporin-like protein [Halteromyces radiatus]
MVEWSSSTSSSTLDETEPLLLSEGTHHHLYDHRKQHYKMMENLIKKGRMYRSHLREYLAEFIGTCILVLLICGASAEQTLHVEPNKSWLTSSIGSGLAVLIAISIVGHVSGAHINPAVTITFWLFSGFPLKKVPGFILSQLLGAFTGAAILYSVIQPAINEFDGGDRQILGPHGTAGIFATFPAVYVGMSSSVLSEVVGTALLLLIIMATGHQNNLPFRNAQGCFIAVGIVSISLSLGYTSGFSLNPARDLGPRLFTSIAGWGSGVFTVRNYYFFVPLFAPIAGAIIGGACYTIFIDQ